MVLLAEPDTVPPELLDPFKKNPCVICKPTDEQLASAEVGVTDVFAGVARTGSICLSITGKLGGVISLFPRKHVAVLEAKNIVPRPRDVFSLDYFPTRDHTSNIVFITGPSATADMGSLVHGVHGPGKLHIIILE